MRGTEDANSPRTTRRERAATGSPARGALTRGPLTAGACYDPAGVPLRLAIVVPTLDEEETLRAHLPAVTTIAHQVVVSDGGSTDRTCEVAASLGARVVRGAPGRGGQLNRGAAACDADLLLFLHADTALPAGADVTVRQAVAAGHEGGGFLVRFAPDTAVFRLGSALVNARTRLTRLPLGDQAQFVTRDAFHRLGGYREWPILEDLDFAWRLRRDGRLVVLPAAVTTSARRFQRRGIARTVATNWLIWTLFAAGVPPHRLARLYGQVR
jgi:rSAM/selenodomain-associated transferase 2